MWENKGRLLVISVPYRVGVHTAKRLSDFVPIMKHLDHLHAHGKVHGDIRAFGEIWQARSAGPIAAGNKVKVEGIDGLVLEVKEEG